MTNVTRRIKAGLIAFALVLAQVVMPVQSAFANNGNGNGNNGTLKVHEKGTPSGTESNDPKVCVFNFEAFGLDAGQTGNITIETQSGTPVITPVAVSLTTDLNGDGATEYINDTTSTVTLANGHYKATLDNKFGEDEDKKAKSKVFKVECAAQPTEVTPNVQIIDECGIANDSVIGTAVNGISYQVTNAGLAYTVVASPVSVDYTLVAGNSFTLTANGTATRTVTLTNTNCPRVVVPCEQSTGMTTVTQASQFADYQDTRSKGHYEFTEDGLHIYTDDNSSQAKVAWYHGVDYALSEVGVPAMDYTATNGIQPGMQLVVDFDGNGTPDGTLVGEAVYGNDWWLSNGSAQFVKDNAPSHTGGSGSANHGTLSQWLTNFPAAQVKAVGFSLGSGVLADGVLKSLTFGCYTWTFKAPARVPVTVCPEVLPIIHSTNAAKNGWNVPSDAEYVQGGIKLNVGGDWDSTFISRPMVGPLADIGSQVDFTSNPNQYTGIHITTDKGTLTYEKEATYDGKWWSESDFGVASGMGYATFDTLENIVAANPDVMTSLLRVLYTHPEASSTVVTSVTVGCTKFTFNAVGGSGGVGDPTTPVIPTIPTTPVVPAPVVPAGGSGALLPEELPMTGENGSILFTWIALLAAILTYGAVYYMQPKKRFEQ